MESEELTEQIFAKVKEKLEGMGIHTSDNRRGLLILSERHGTDCHALLENPELNKRFRVICALQADYCIDFSKVGQGILFDLNCSNLSKLACGMADTPYLQAALRLMMEGRQILVPESEIEFFQYQNSMPEPLYRKMEDNLAFLKKCGLKVIKGELNLENICRVDETEDGKSCMCRKENGQNCSKCRGTGENAREITTDRKLITERDILEAERAGAGCVCIGSRCIITDLAIETAARKNILIRRNKE